MIQRFFKRNAATRLNRPSDGRNWLSGRALRSYGVRSRQRRSNEQPGLPTFAAFGVLFGLLLGVILAMPLSPNAGIVQGEPSPVDVRASRPLIYQSDVLTRQAQETATNDPSLVVANVDAALPARQRSDMQRMFQRIEATRRNDVLSEEQRQTALTALSSSVISPTIASQIAMLDDSRWQLIADESLRIYDNIWARQPNGLSESDIATIRTRTLPDFAVSRDLSPEERDMVLHFVSAFLAPNRDVNEQATEQRQATARAAVAPVLVTVRKGESIVREGDFVTDAVYEKLQKLGLVFGAGGVVAFAQQFLLGMLVAWLLSSYLYFYKTELAQRRRGLAIIAGVLAAVVLAARWLVPLWEPTPFGFPLAIAGILLTMLFDKQLGLFSVLILAPLVGLQAEQSVGLTITLALSSAAGVFATQRATRSATFVLVTLAVSLVTALAASVFWFDRVDGTPWPEALSIPLLSALNGTLASILAIGMYQLLGRVAHIATPLQLMELAHPNQPLLHRLMREAPGTYHHSIVVANLAEVAAEDIGADALLAKIGAYYHDIGKVIRPYFFTDNQYERSNVHEELDAKTSATLIIDHVRDGVKLGHAHGLPPQIIDFIQQHHGTTVVSYFYQRALHGDGDVDIADFRYPGPRPQLRETGILMLADGVEAAVRAHAQSGKLQPARPEEHHARERNGASISTVVEQIVTDRLRTGQLDECPLTLRDISIIKASFIKTLQGIYHPRVEYPPAARPVVSEPI